MTRMILSLAIAGAVGCTGVRPVGPLSGMTVGMPGSKGKPAKDKDAPPEPVTVPAPKPTPPLHTVDPDEVLPDNPQAAAQKLQNEIEAERKHIPAAPVTAEVSRYKGGVKQPQ